MIPAGGDPDQTLKVDAYSSDETIVGNIRVRYNDPDTTGEIAYEVPLIPLITFIFLMALITLISPKILINPINFYNLITPITLGAQRHRHGYPPRHGH